MFYMTKPMKLQFPSPNHPTAHLNLVALSSVRNTGIIWEETQAFYLSLKSFFSL